MYSVQKVIVAACLLVMALIGLDWFLSEVMELNWLQVLGLDVLVVLALTIALFIALLRLVVVPEEKAVAFKYLGRFVYMAMEYTDRSFDSAGFIVERSGPNGWGKCWCIWRIGGWVFYLYPFVEPAKYGDYNNPDHFGEGIYVHLGDTTTEPFVVQAETTESDGSEIALDVKLVSTKRIVHPYRWLFRSPRDADNQVVRRENSMSRAWVKSGDKEHAQSAKGNGVKLWGEIVALGGKDVFDKIKNDWGQRILENSIIVEDVGYDPEYQKALKAKSEQELLAKGEHARLFGPIKDAISPEEYAKLTKEEAIKIRSQGLAGDNFSLDQEHTTIDVTSGGQPINPNFAGMAASANIIGKAIARALGGKKNPSGGSSGGDKDKDKDSAKERQKKMRERWQKKKDDNKG